MIDIGCNLIDEQFQGVYSRQYHDPDLADVVQRAVDVGVEKIVATAGNLEEAQGSLRFCEMFPSRVFTTVGVHPTRCEVARSDPQKYLADMLALAQANKGQIVALGEMGLDYDRLHYCGKEWQQQFFEMQLQTLAQQTRLPLFLHMRAAADDFLDILHRNRDKFTGGVVHSFTGAVDEMQRLVSLGLHIGINGCSLKTEQNLEVVKQVPLDKLCLETDAPYCRISSTSAGFKYVTKDTKKVLTQWPEKQKDKWVLHCRVKSRNEPCNILEVADVVSVVRGCPRADIVAAVRQTTVNLFFPEFSQQ
eukprot:TRINITY_DN4791_c0_g1_i2.p2 TRINITY_DN4791_c0_g1~~TRINITY_DN4791_c0_g1_i2.p2  ORF type:complete len:305 (+),score=81.48 TRINITY_DN4791_c0_g1_i2:3-917(+)